MNSVLNSKLPKGDHNGKRVCNRVSFENNEYGLCRVLLILKNRPVWQQGLLNGIGGKIDSGETPMEAIHRECKEETGLVLIWTHRAIIKEQHAICHIFYSYDNRSLPYQQLEDELLGLYPIGSIDYFKCVDDLATLIDFGITGSKDTFLTINRN